jgi:hypothetical protein
MEPDDKQAGRRGNEIFLDIPDPLNIAREAPPAPMPRFDAPSPTRSEMRRRRRWALRAAFILPLLALAIYGVREQLRENALLVLVQCATWLALLAIASIAALSRGRAGMGSSVRLAEIVAFLAPASFLALALGWVPQQAHTELGAVGPVAQIFKCMSLGLAVSLPLLLVAIWSLRYAWVSAAGWRGAALGAASGLVAVFALTLHCGNDFGAHIAIGHGTPLVLSTLIGALLAIRWARA